MSAVTPATDATTAANDVATGGAGNVTKNATSDVARLRRGACPRCPPLCRPATGCWRSCSPLELLTPESVAVGLARLARELGNGIVEVTARGKLQLRGLTTASAPRLPEAVDTLESLCRKAFRSRRGALGRGSIRPSVSTRARWRGRFPSVLLLSSQTSLPKPPSSSMAAARCISAR